MRGGIPPLPNNSSWCSSWLSTLKEVIRETKTDGEWRNVNGSKGVDCEDVN